MLDHLLAKSTVLPEEVISPGGEIINSRSKLHSILKTYGIIQPEKYLKEVTTRQAHPDGKRLFEIFDYGQFFEDQSDLERTEIILELIQVLIGQVNQWFERQNIKLQFEKHHSPTEWVKNILEIAKGKSGGVVEQHLIGATLQCYHSNIFVDNFPGHAADFQTGRVGDFLIGASVYHVTAAPTPAVIQKCSDNTKSSLHPILLVPSEIVSKAKSFAEYTGVQKQITVVAIENFIAIHIIEMANWHQVEFSKIFQKIIEIYNQRIEAVETDMSLKIDVE